MEFDINESGLAEKVAALLEKGLVGAIPCDTVYGFSAKAIAETAERIFALKKRPKNKSLIMLTTKEDLRKSNLVVPEKLYSVWPAPLTAILMGGDGVTHAVRVPSDKFLSELLPLSGPIWSTSVNVSGEAPLNTYSEIMGKFSGEVDFIIKKDGNAKALPSTIVDFSSKSYKVLRQGSYLIDLASM